MNYVRIFFSFLFEEPFETTPANALKLTFAYFTPFDLLPLVVIKNTRATEEFGLAISFTTMHLRSERDRQVSGIYFNY